MVTSDGKPTSETVRRGENPRRKNETTQPAEPFDFDRWLMDLGWCEYPYLGEN
jgi:hypothetical protein